MPNFNLESRDMGFHGVTEGVNRAGMEAYMEYLKVEVIDKIVEALGQVEEMQTQINQGWQGRSRDVFLAQFNNTIANTSNEIQAEFSNLADRLSDLYQSYFEQDAKMLDM